MTMDIIYTFVIGFGLVGCGYWMAHRDAKMFFVSLVDDLDKAGVVKTTDIINFLKERTNK